MTDAQFLTHYNEFDYGNSINILYRLYMGTNEGFGKTFLSRSKNKVDNL